MDQEAPNVAQKATDQSKFGGEATRDADGQNKPFKISFPEQKNFIIKQL